MKIIAVFSVLMFIVAYAVWVERKVLPLSRIAVALTASGYLASCSLRRTP